MTAGDGNRGFDAFASPQNPLRLIPLSKQSEQPNDSSSLNDSDESERTGELLGIAEARIRGGHKLDFNFYKCFLTYNLLSFFLSCSHLDKVDNLLTRNSFGHYLSHDKFH